MLSRRVLLSGLALTAQAARAPRLGTTLVHEHILVDFIGADQASPSRYNSDEVVRAALPKLRELKARGCQTLLECTPQYLGRDVRLLARLSKESGLRILTNTGWYGANNDKHLPKLAWTEPPEAIAARWTREFREGIDGTKIKPAFQKIGVDAGPLSEVDRKLITAGCICHQQTKLRLHVHTGNGVAATQILEELARRSVPASAYVWVHAQNETDRAVHVAAAKAGAWIEFDGIGPKRLDVHVKAVSEMIQLGYLNQLLISQDSGWYRVGEPGGGTYNGYVYLFDAFLPALRQQGVTERQIRTLLVDNPARVLSSV